MFARLVPLLSMAVLCAAGCKKTAPSADPGEETAAAAGSAEAPAENADPLAAPPDVAAPPADAQRTESGLATKVLRPGTGTEHPTARDRVTVHYTGWTTDGQRFDSSVERGQPASFGLSQVIRGWTEGLQLMVKGEKRRLWIPEELAYQGRPGAPQGMLVFDVELLDFMAQPEPPTAPPDVAAVPADAKKTRSGLAYRVLQPGQGGDKPGDDARVEMNFSGWTSDGRLFATTALRNQPQVARVGSLFPGWAEGVKDMVPGEKRRLWVPQELAYQGRPGAPPGMLVLDVELLRVLPEQAGAAPAAE